MQGYPPALIRTTDRLAYIQSLPAGTALCVGFYVILEKIF